MPAKLEVCSFNRVGIISPYFPKIKGSRYPGHVPLFENFFYGVMSRLSVGTYLPNLKLIALNVLVLDSGHHLHYKIDGPKFANPSP